MYIYVCVYILLILITLKDIFNKIVALYCWFITYTDVIKKIKIQSERKSSTDTQIPIF